MCSELTNTSEIKLEPISCVLNSQTLPNEIKLEPMSCVLNSQTLPNEIKLEPMYIRKCL
jgi:hypothetical protein